MGIKPESTTGATIATTASSGQCWSAGCGCIGRLMKKLKKHSNKMLCMAYRPVTFDCHYDPLSYARNFDHGGCDSDDSGRFLYAFSARFVSAAKKPLVQGNVTR